VQTLSRFGGCDTLDDHIELRLEILDQSALSPPVHKRPGAGDRCQPLADLPSDFRCAGCAGERQPQTAPGHGIAIADFEQQLSEAAGPQNLEVFYVDRFPGSHQQLQSPFRSVVLASSGLWTSVILIGVDSEHGY